MILLLPCSLWAVEANVYGLWSYFYLSIFEIVCGLRFLKRTILAKTVVTLLCIRTMVARGWGSSLAPQKSLSGLILGMRPANERRCYCPACRTTFIATRFRVAVICPIIPVPHCIRVFFYFVWFVFINHIFQFYYELCTYCNILDIYLS